MAASYALLGVLLMLDALFLVNMLIIKALRNYSNRKAAYENAETQNVDFAEASRQEEARYGCDQYCTAICCGLCCDVVRKDVNEIRIFPGWKKLSLGHWTTAIIIIATCVLLSPEVLPSRVGVYPAGGFKVDLCTVDDFEGRIEQLVERIDKVTNFTLAKRQKEHTLEFQKALVKDTSLYGTGRHSCQDAEGRNGEIVSGMKEDWKDPTVPPAATYGPFFPGYCGAALEAALSRSREMECAKKVCSCPTKLVLGKHVPLCFLGRACVDVAVACPPHTVEEDDDEVELQNYRMAQLEKADKLQEQVLKNTFVGYVDEQITENASEAVEKLLFQVDVASSAYVLYTCLGLFFAAPLILFRPPMLQMIRDYLFGIHKFTFIILVVAIWWGIEYFQGVFTLPSVQLYLDNLRLGEPCFLDSDFLQRRTEIFNDVCEEMLPMEKDWETSFSTIDQVLIEVGFFIDSCNCPFPNEMLEQLRTPDYISAEDASVIGFTREIDGISGILAPNNGTKFLGDATVCTNFTLANKLIFEEPETETNWWEIWITTGILAQVLIKFAVTNFGIALYRFADPLSYCAGRFQWPNSDRFRMLNGSSEKEWRAIRTEKTQIFRIIAFKWSIIWGLIVHLCIFNLIFTPSDYKDEETLYYDSIVFKVTTSIAGLSILFGFLFVCVKNKEANQKFPREEPISEKESDEDKIDGKSISSSAKNSDTMNSTEDKN